MPVHNFSVPSKHRNNMSMNYQLYLPKEYGSQSGIQYPLILFLHGTKKRGEDISMLNEYGLTWIAENKGNFPFIVLTPQCPTDSNWTNEYHKVINVVEEISSIYQVDATSIYVTGFSMGGNGAWDFASKSPDLFSAVVPISAYYDPSKAPLLKDMPIWAFHCVDDDIVPVSQTEEMVKALTEVGSSIRFTYYKGLKHGHNVMNETFNNEELYTWLLKHKRKI